MPGVALTTTNSMQFRGLVLLASLLASGCGEDSNSSHTPTPIIAQTSNAGNSEIPQGNGFDFYVLSLSWSPHYCASKGRDGDPQQCRASKPFGFIVHGLWPQNERGYPQDCATSDEPSRDEIRSVSDLTPSAGLVRHEWKKHGSCSGLSPSDYFKVTRAARQLVTMPVQFTNAPRAISLSANQIETAFVQANPGISTNGVAVDCDRQKLAEARICMSKSLQFRDCPEVDRAGCRAQSITIEPVK